MRALVLTGPPGAGKTTVLASLMGLLEAGDVRYAAVEVEALALVHPWPDDDAAFAHVAFLAASFRRRGYPLLLVGATIEDPEYLHRLLEALSADEVFLVALTASPDLLRARITAREPPDWVGLPRLLEATERLATAIAGLPGVDLALTTDGAEARAVADRIRHTAGL